MKITITLSDEDGMSMIEDRRPIYQVIMDTIETILTANEIDYDSLYMERDE